MLKLLLLIVVAFFIDLYFQRGFKQLFNKRRSNFLHYFIRINWIFFLFFTAFSTSYLLLFQLACDHPFRVRYVIWIHTFFLLTYMPKTAFNLFLLLRDILRLIRVSIEKIVKKRVISKVLIKKRFLKSGFILSCFLFMAILYGIGFGKNHFKVKKIDIHFEDLPESFNKYKLVQISDIHFGSYGPRANFKNAVEIINDLDADLVVFTGDMVNFKAEEAEAWISLFKTIKSEDGKFAVLGNHDFGDYIECYDQEDRNQNLEKLLNSQGEMGFRNLMNESTHIFRGKDSLLLVGVMNWAIEPYKKYGDLHEALGTGKNSAFKILLSHDPHHWEMEVKDKYTIDLTLSGHTHGAQFGIDLPFYQWCPIDWMYTYWGGLYEENSKYLYINQGLGVIGFHGRIGMRPEITLISLHSKKINQ